ncbi:class I SAM-dependent methyltransferase [Burkholderia pseudomultivorans]|uniref:class I SAM-dependent methyltransferase n=1 Tax=Burkholderia pseudomultivorans TaxID=1207504 RepID=UPI000B189E8D|nr:class I SAM-dependent methyltransferase [Burkholderia pseudomultivorans]
MIRRLSESGRRVWAAVAGKRADRVAPDRVIFSFVVDANPKFAYQGYHLARSLIEYSVDAADDVHVQFTAEVPVDTRALFAALGCSQHQIERFGDGRYCNKIAQLANLHALEFDVVVLLDTDMIALGDIRPFLSNSHLVAKPVDLPNPPAGVLQEIARLAGMEALPAAVQVDASTDVTLAGNFNGGFYGIPRHLCRRVDDAWRHWATWLIDNIEPLRKIGKEMHVDQVSMWIALNVAGIPYRSASANVNYYIHFNGAHNYLDPASDIVLLHYHDASLNVLGKLEPPAVLDSRERRAVEQANRQISRGFENSLFWNLRYSLFPERGSGVGSRGENLLYKRKLLMEEGVEESASVLDVGCGDLEVVKPLKLRNYLGLDTSHLAIEAARGVRPDWTFAHVDHCRRDALPFRREMVLCFEVLIHQRSEADYRELVRFLADCTDRTLIVSGYASDYEGRAENSMVYFYEPLDESLRKTGKFESIRRIGSHTDVAVFRCDV